MPSRRRVIDGIARDRFAAGWRLALDEVVEDVATPGGGPVLLPRPPSDPSDPSDPADADDAIRVDIVRPRDLVALSVSFTGCERVGGGASPPVVRPVEGATARLFVDHAFQHALEEAVLEVRSLEADPATGGARRPWGSSRTCWTTRRSPPLWGSGRRGPADWCS